MEGGRVSLVGPGFGRVPVVVAERRASLVTNWGVCVGWPHFPGHDPVGRVAANALAMLFLLGRLRCFRFLDRWRWLDRFLRVHELGSLVDLLGYLQHPISVLVAGIVQSRQHHRHQIFLPLSVGTEHACAGSKRSIYKFTRLVHFLFLSFTMACCAHTSSGDPCILLEAGYSPSAITTNGEGTII